MEQSRSHPELSEREQQLIMLAAQGLTDTVIANRLGISEPTVKSYWIRVRSKLGPFNRTELVAHAVREESQMTISELNGEIQRLRDVINNEGQPPLEIHREMLESAPDAVFVVDDQGFFLWLNMEAERMFGYRFDELVGKPVSTLVPSTLHDRHRVHMKHYYAEPERRTMGEHRATMAVRKDGVEFSIVASLGAIDTPNGQVVTCFVREISGAKALESFAWASTRSDGCPHLPCPRVPTEG